MIAILSVIISALVSHNLVFFGGLGTFAQYNDKSINKASNSGSDIGSADSAGNIRSAAESKGEMSENSGEDNRINQPKSNTLRCLMLGCFVAIIVFLSGIICWLCNRLLVRMDAEYLSAFVCIIVAALLALALDILLKKFRPSWRLAGSGLVLIAAVSAAIVTLAGITSLGAWEMLFASLFSGIGYILALLLVDGIAQRLETAEVPRFFRGVPILVLAAAIVALAFMGFESFSFTIG